MKKLGIIALILLGIYGFWKMSYPSGTFRYRLTLVVDDNGKQVIASSVRQVTVRDGPRLTPESNPTTTLHGEAVVVDLGEKGVFFALLRSKDSVDYGYNIVYDAFPNLGGTTPKGIRAYSNLKAKKELSFDKIPMLVRFRNINDPKTVELVDPNDLEKTFGKGVKLVSATLEMTDENVTTGVEKWLPWIGEYRNKLFDGNTIMTGDAKNRLANDLGTGAFSTEIYK